MVVTSKKEDFLTSHVQNFEYTSIKNPIRGGVGSVGNELFGINVQFGGRVRQK